MTSVKWSIWKFYYKLENVTGNKQAFKWKETEIYILIVYKQVTVNWDKKYWWLWLSIVDGSLLVKTWKN